MEENLFNKRHVNHNFIYDLMDTNSDTQTQTQSDFRQTMKSESNRLKTFYINDQCLWPVPGVCPQDLARAGFYYLDDDRVKCAFCTGVISCWTPGLRPLEEHSNHYPLCPYIMEEDVGNIPIDIDPVRGSLPAVGHDVCGYRPMPTEELSEQIQSSGSLTGSRTSSRTNSPSHLEELGVQLYSGPKNPDMGPIDIRKASFVDKEWPENTPVSTDRLAEAGFYYIGYKDAVKCFHCGLGLAQWEEGDDPWIEHAKKDPNCYFLKLNKSQPFIDECKRLEQINNEESPESAAHRDDDMKCCSAVNQWLSSDLVKEFMNVNLFSPDLVKTALNQRYYSHKKPFDSFADLYDAVNTLQRSNESIGQSDNASLNVIENGIGDVTEVKSPVPSTAQQSSEEPSGAANGSNPDQSSNTLISNATSDAFLKSNATENEKKKMEPNVENKLLCKLCYLSEIEVVFLPCGHQLSCTECAQRLTNCAVCRQPIRGYVRTFFS